MNAAPQEEHDMSQQHHENGHPDIVKILKDAIKHDTEVQDEILKLVIDAAKVHDGELARSIVARTSDQLGQNDSDLTKIMLEQLADGISKPATDEQKGLVAAINAQLATGIGDPKTDQQKALVAAIKKLGVPAGGGNNGGHPGTDQVRIAIGGFKTECRADIATLTDKSSQTTDTRKLGLIGQRIDALTGESNAQQGYIESLALSGTDPAQVLKDAKTLHAVNKQRTAELLRLLG